MTKGMNERVGLPRSQCPQGQGLDPHLLQCGATSEHLCRRAKLRGSKALGLEEVTMGAVGSSAREDIPKPALSSSTRHPGPFHLLSVISARSLGSFGAKRFHLAFYFSSAPSNNLQGRPCIPILAVKEARARQAAF